MEGENAKQRIGSRKAAGVLNLTTTQTSDDLNWLANSNVMVFVGDKLKVINLSLYLQSLLLNENVSGFY